MVQPPCCKFHVGRVWLHAVAQWAAAGGRVLIALLADRLRARPVAEGRDVAIVQVYPCDGWASRASVRARARTYRRGRARAIPPAAWE